MILLENGPGGRPVLFDDADELVVCTQPGDVGPALRWLEGARAGGAWVAGYIAYEAGYALEPRLAPLMPAEREGPLLAFGIYTRPKEPGAAALPSDRARLTPMVPRITRQDYDAAFARAQDHIAAGDCYQVNLTFPLEGRLTEGSALDLYAALKQRQPVGYGGFCDFGVGPAIVSRSPELFFRTDASGRIEARPMKGTAPRDADPGTDAGLVEGLRASEKNRAENLMIVDLLRNDIARIARVGSVKVPELYAVDTFATLHQMSSRVVGQLARPADLHALMAALFPCGSITGAPKIRAMEIIRDLEPFARGAYCGAIGWMGPDGAACFSVAIRTLSVFEQRVVMNVGGGVVHQSTADGEWEEALWKTAFVQALTTPR
ncbi:MAG: aminodeoxychorismate synthase component I [Paracoccaceae bacterium]